MNWSLRDAVFTGRSFEDYATSLVREYTTVLCFSIGGGDARAPAPFHTLGCGGFLERSLMC